jgi:chaperonin GroES
LKVKFEPAPNKVLVRVADPVTITKNGIHVPDSAQMRPMEGVIVKIGPNSDTVDKLTKGVVHVEPLWKEKDHVLFGKYDGIEIRIDEEDFLLLNHDQILGKRTGN